MTEKRPPAETPSARPAPRPDPRPDSGPDSGPALTPAVGQGKSPDHDGLNLDRPRREASPARLAAHPRDPLSPAVILVAPQLGENIGMVARAMLNCGLDTLRLVAPRAGWPNAHAEKAASGAITVLEGAQVYGSTAEAIADLHYVYATTARSRDMVKPAFTPRGAADRLRGDARAGLRCGLLFGRERSGLENDDIALADAILHVPLNPAFMSLNLAQAVLIVGYEWWTLAETTPPERVIMHGSPPATKAELLGFFEHLESALDRAGFLRPPEKRPRMIRNLRSLFARASPTEQEVRTLRGVVAALSGRYRHGRTIPTDDTDPPLTEEAGPVGGAVASGHDEDGGSQSTV